MFKKLTATLGVIAASGALLFNAQPASAISLDFDPSNPSVVLGNPLSVDVVVDPMGAFVGAFDVIVSWDDAVLDLAALSVDPANDLGSAFEVVDTLGTTDSVNVASFSTELDLTPFQDGIAPVILFSLTFDTIALGNSALTFTPGIGGLGLPPGVFLGDENGLPLQTPANDGSVTVVDSAAVPAPPTLLLMACGLIGLVAARRGSTVAPV